MGFEDGSLRAHKLHLNSLENMASTYWSMNIHDNQCGVISSIGISFDGRYVMSAGEDGNLFVFKFHETSKMQSSFSNFDKKLDWDLNSEFRVLDQVDDIKDPNHYRYC